MNRDFEFKQLLRAYRTGIISETTFEHEMSLLENGNGKASNGHGGFRAFGKTYASEREAIVKFLEAASVGETNAGEALPKWLAICQTDCIRGGIKMVAEREAYHGRVFAQRLKELGGTMPDRNTDEARKNVAYISDPSISDLEKLARGATRFPNPEEIIRPIFEFAAAIKEDYQTREMVRLFAEDELSTLKWQKALHATLTASTTQAGAAATA
ncbi:MAG: hypothetical protein Q7S58_03950 [Candidatus Binatus sp.]|uniref:hypothetical protein n=1 Tax=Candidatus Binatus sp. TaxID=2811406 RepID=UPI0027212D9E|nr:hypothetical protein [Candidatus Binatus sp.]MDO8431544.1 hypothetical protein [Candidatus Binatus sp.]